MNKQNINPKIGKKTKLSEEEILRRLKQLTTRINRFKGQLDTIQKKDEVERRKQMEFIFQSVSTTIGIFSIVLAVIIGLSTQWGFEIHGKTLVIFLLFFISILLLIWYYHWICKN